MGIGRCSQERARILKKWSNEIAQCSSELAGLMCMESGKPQAEAKGEVNYARSFIDFYAGMQPSGLVLQPQTSNQTLLVAKEVRAIAPTKSEWQCAW